MAGIEHFFKTKRTADIVEPSWFGGIKGYSSDTEDDGTVVEYCMLNLFCDIYKFEQIILPMFKSGLMGEDVKSFYQEFKKTVDAIKEDANDPNNTEDFFNFVRCGFIYNKDWEKGVYKDGDNMMFFLDLLEITDKELRKNRVNDEIDKNVYFYCDLNPETNYKIFSDPTFNEDVIEKCGWKDIIDNYMKNASFGPIRNMNKNELIKLKRYNKVSLLEQ